MSRPDVIEPWDTGSGQMYISYTEILRLARGTVHITPEEIAESRRRMNVIRIQCRRLARIGVLVSVGHDAFSLSEMGSRYLEGDRQLPEKDGDLDVPALLDPQSHPGRAWRMTEFEGLDAEDIKQVNLIFLEEEENDYGLVQESASRTEQRIRNVKDSRINRVIREFPREEPVPNQCAHWMRTFSGLHFFPDANHRTGMATLEALLELNNIRYRQWPGSGIERTVLRSKLTRVLNVDARFDTLWLRDELYWVWYRHFYELFFGAEQWGSSGVTVDFLRDVLSYVRQLATGK